MTEKQKALEMLKEKGYDAALEEGIIMITVNENHFSLEQIRKDIEELGYRYSWGIKSKKEVE